MASDASCAETLACVTIVDIPEINVRGVGDIFGPGGALGGSSLSPGDFGDLAATLGGIAVQRGGAALQTGGEILSDLLAKPLNLPEFFDPDFLRLMAGDVGTAAPEAAAVTGAEAAGIGAAGLAGLFGGLLLAPSRLGSHDTVLDPNASLGSAAEFPVPEVQVNLPPPPAFELPPEIVVLAPRGDQGAPPPRSPLPFDPGFQFEPPPPRVVRPAPFIAPFGGPSSAARPGAPPIAFQPQPQPIPRAAPKPRPSPAPGNTLAGGGSPLTGFDTRSVPSPAARPGPSALPLGSCACEQGPKATERKKKYGCRQGYFRETSDGITYTTWSTRKCPSSKVNSHSQRQARPITS